MATGSPHQQQVRRGRDLLPAPVQSPGRAPADRLPRDQRKRQTPHPPSVLPPGRKPRPPTPVGPAGPPRCRLPVAPTWSPWAGLVAGRRRSLRCATLSDPNEARTTPRDTRADRPRTQQQLNPELAPDGWRPQYVDYLILGVTTSTA